MFFTYSPIYRYSGSFRILAIVNYAAKNMGSQIALWNIEFISLGYIPKSGIAGLYTSCSLKFLRRLHNINIINNISIIISIIINK